MDNTMFALLLKASPETLCANRSRDILAGVLSACTSSDRQPLYARRIMALHNRLTPKTISAFTSRRSRIGGFQNRRMSTSARYTPVSFRPSMISALYFCSLAISIYLGAREIA